MKIIQLVESLDIGGLPNYVLQLAKLQKKFGHEVCVGYVKGKPGGHLETADIDVVHVPNFESVKKLDIEIIHIHLLSDIDFLKALDEQNDFVVIRSFHDYTSTCLRRGKRRFPGDRCHRPLDYGCAMFGCIIGPPTGGSKLPRLMNLSKKINERDIYRKFDAAICGSYHMKNMLASNGFDENKLHRIPYFSKFESEADKETLKEKGAGDSRPVELLFSGQAVKGKGLEVLIEALGMLPKDLKWHLTVFCEGPRLEPAKQIAKESGINDKITYNSWVEQSVLIDSYKKADIFILPSIWDDPGPLVGIEALSCGTPVVGFAVGGVPDYVLDQETGFLVTDVSSKGLCEGIIRAMKAPEKLNELTARCKSLVKANHTSGKHLEKVIKVYKEALVNKV